MTVLKVPSTLVSTGSRLSYPRLDGDQGWLEASELLGSRWILAHCYAK